MPVYAEVIGYLASILIPLAFLPQTIKIIKTKNTNGISILSYSIYFIGVMLFLIHGIVNYRIPLIVCQTINGIISGIIFSMVIYNLIKNKERK